MARYIIRRILQAIPVLLFISAVVYALIEISPVVKVTYIIGMLAGRLEILPVLLLFSPRVWR